MKRTLIPIFSVIVGIIAFALSHRYLAQERAKLEAERRAINDRLRTVIVVRAQKQVAANTVIRKGDLGRIRIPLEALSKDHIVPEEAGVLFGKKTLYPLETAEPVMWSYIDMPRRRSDRLADAISSPELRGPSMRAISISVSGAAAVSGLVKPNDRIDVLGTFNFPKGDGSGEFESITLTILQDVTVLATGQTLATDRFRGQAAQRRSVTGYSTVTVEVRPREAELLVFAEQSRGALTMSLRHPSDVDFETDLPSVNFQHLESKLQEYNFERQRLIHGKPESLFKKRTRTP